MKKLFTLSMAAVLAGAAFAHNVTEFDYGYATPGAETSAFGVGRLVKYDVAILIDNPALEGYQVVGVNAEISNRAECACAPEAKGWLTSELLSSQLTGDIMIDLAEKDGVIENTGTEEAPVYMLNINFDEPYTITSEPFYAGYTVSVTALKSWTQGYPIVTAPSDNPDGGLFVHCDKGPSGSGYKYLEWTDLANSRAAVSTMNVRLRGPRGEESVSLSYAGGKIYAISGEETTFPVRITNFGSADVKSFDYEVLSDGTSFGGETVTLIDKIPARFGENTELDLRFTAPETLGEYPLTIAITKVNGKENQNSAKSIAVDGVVRNYYPKHIPLVEEYTGLWCGQCPEAFVLLSETKEKYPDLLYLAFHENDALMTISPGDLPAIGGAPRLTIDRSSAGSYKEFEGNWLARRSEPAPADIDVRISWTDETKETLRVDADVKFVENHENAGYALTYCLVADNMKDESYKQRNYFYDDTSKSGKYWDLFVGKGMEVAGLSYSEVVLAFPDCKGIEDSLPETILADETYNHFSTFNLADVKNVYTASSIYGQNILKESDKENLRVVGVLTDLATGKSYNCSTSGYSRDAEVYDPASSGIDEISGNSAAAAIIATEYYAIDGIRLSHLPEKGAVIIVNHYDDGSAKTAKLLQ